MSRPTALLLGLALVASSGRSQACMNDSELDEHEREFRSQYGPKDGVLDAEAPRPIPSEVLVAGGAVLLVGALGLAARRDRAKGA